MILPITPMLQASGVGTVGTDEARELSKKLKFARLYGMSGTVFDNIQQQLKASKKVLIVGVRRQGRTLQAIIDYIREVGMPINNAQSYMTKDQSKLLDDLLKDVPKGSMLMEPGIGKGPVELHGTSTGRYDATNPNGTIYNKNYLPVASYVVRPSAKDEFVYDVLQYNSIVHQGNSLDDIVQKYNPVYYETAKGTYARL